MTDREKVKAIENYEKALLAARSVVFCSAV
jgi:hypothetical protein